MLKSKKNMSRPFYVWKNKAEQDEAYEVARELIDGLVYYEDLKYPSELLKMYPDLNSLMASDGFNYYLKQTINDTIGQSRRRLTDEERVRSRELFTEWVAKIRQALAGILAAEKEFIVERARLAMVEPARLQREADRREAEEDGENFELTEAEWEQEQREGLPARPSTARDSRPLIGKIK